jgi:hypothetical protein
VNSTTERRARSKRAIVTKIRPRWPERSKRNSLH